MFSKLQDLTTSPPRRIQFNGTGVIRQLDHKRLARSDPVFKSGLFPARVSPRRAGTGSRPVSGGHRAVESPHAVRHHGGHPPGEAALVQRRRLGIRATGARQPEDRSRLRRRSGPRRSGGERRVPPGEGAQRSPLPSGQKPASPRLPPPYTVIGPGEATMRGSTRNTALAGPTGTLWGRRPF